MGMNYSTDKNLINDLDVSGFFVGWPNPPSNETLKRIIHGSHKVILAHQDGKLIGFINSISDGVLSAYIPLLEVLPEFQKHGIGSKLVSKIQEELKDLYMVDLLCDADLIPYYEKLGMQKAQGVCLRNYSRQSGQEKT